MNAAAARWRQRLRLRQHPEGGWYRETYRSADGIPASALPARYRNGNRAFGTAIYYLLSDGAFSAFHRVASDELWHAYAGGTLCLHLLTPTGARRLRLSPRPGARDAHPQALVPAGTWFAAELERPGAYALVGCTVAPGFDSPISNSPMAPPLPTPIRASAA